MAVPETALVHVESSVLDAGFSPEALARRLEAMKSALSITQQFFREVMVEGQDYGKVPGTEKPTLLKPGAEKLCELYGLAIVLKSVEETADRQTGFFRAKVVTQLISRRTGEVVAEGIGEANTSEGRYRWRWVPEWKLPTGLDKQTLYYEERRGKDGGTYKMFRVENDDLFSLWNTVMKMAKKRALVDAVLSATRSSGVFTQDAEDLAEWIAGDAAEDSTLASRAKGPKNHGDDRAKADQHQGDDRTRAVRQLFAMLKGDPNDPKFGATNKGLTPEEAEALVEAAEEKAGKPIEEWTASEVKALTDTLRKIAPDKLRARVQKQLEQVDLDQLEQVDLDHIATVNGL